MRVLIVTNMYPTPDEPAFGTFVKDQVDALQRAGVDIDVFFVNGRANTLNYLWGIFRFWGVLLRKRYHLIHAHYAMSGFIARLQFFYPIVVTYHGGELRDHSPAWVRIPARRARQLFNWVILVNKHEKKLIINHDEHVVVIPCGVNLEEFCPISMAEARKQLNFDPGKLLILWAGEYWQPEKNYQLLEASVELLKRRLPNVELVLVSGKPHNIIPVYMSACNALALTSWSEGSPMVIKEAMACNLPIVSTDVGDVADVIGGVEGCYLTESEPEAVAECLFTVLQENKRTRGREKIQATVSSGPITQHILDVYNQLCPPEYQIEFSSI
jgi:teichuronic acid biosynthesis glycosyltransferase TuaC